MKTLTIITLVGAAAMASLGLMMAKTNPEQSEYEQYAVQTLSKYLKSDVCQKTPKFLEKLINFQCDKLVDAVNPQMREIIAATTERHNFIIFSVYHTEIKLDSWIPSYRFETVGAFNQFYTYTAEQQ
jgi:phosphoribulokinase